MSVSARTTSRQICEKENITVGFSLPGSEELLYVVRGLRHNPYYSYHMVSSTPLELSSSGGKISFRLGTVSFPGVLLPTEEIRIEFTTKRGNYSVLCENGELLRNYTMTCDFGPGMGANGVLRVTLCNNAFVIPVSTSNPAPLPPFETPVFYRGEVLSKNRVKIYGRSFGPSELTAFVGLKANGIPFQVISMNFKELVIEGPFENNAQYLLEFDFGGVYAEFPFNYDSSTLVNSSPQGNRSFPFLYFRRWRLGLRTCWCDPWTPLYCRDCNCHSFLCQEKKILVSPRIEFDRNERSVIFVGWKATMGYFFPRLEN